MIHYKGKHVTVFQSVLYMTTSTLIHTDEVMVLIDPNWLPHEIKEIRECVEQHKVSQQLYIIYTHNDFDHIIGSGAFPEAKVIASKTFSNYPHKDNIIQQIKDFDQQYYIHRNYKAEYPSVDFVISNDGEKMNLGDLTFTFNTASGHTSDGLFTIVEPLGIFISGDYLSDVEFPFITSGYKDYLNTMEKAERTLQQNKINLHIPGHGTVTNDYNEMTNRLNFSKYYLNEITSSKSDLEKQCQQKYLFFEGMKDIHYENIKFVKQELGKNCGGE
ncbi:MBL fold metallo-hydrolase [Salinibacillus xinjiangensis]|uniref:MBL fold metallo-hydrolase n=1 Tax=Salinibacillus xinjiangensis TaxID=1229268 RepID=A0A6G1X4W5_9BACI|nr:MBL fold metallo-hydrolase [Salinibacillus xinjiangensis]MRG85920.1 MBL fold metallo-hydrolase [Salinibacillus xinjiangensis]